MKQNIKLIPFDNMNIKQIELKITDTDKFKRINISVPIDLYKQYKHLKESYPIKINISKICQLAIVDKIKQIENNLDKIMELMELKKSIE